MRKLSLTVCSILILSLGLNAQDYHEENGGYNPNSIRPIHVSQQMYRKTLWRMIDLREPQNKGFFAINREISRILIEGAKAGKITPYTNDSLTTVMTIEEFIKKMTIPGMEDAGDDEFGGGGDDWGDDGGGGDEWGDEGGDDDGFGGGDDAAAISNEFLPNTLYQIELKEDMIFDRKRSRMYYDIQALTMYIPADNADNIKGIQEVVCAFKYTDMVKLFQDDKRAYWFNRENNSEHRNMADAFDLRLFGSYITKVDNPDDNYLVDTYGSERGGILGAQIKMFELMEYEHNLWEF